jgi:hypothetical protein
MIPCIENKCLKYPACKNKQFITCTPLRQYLDQNIFILQDESKAWELTNQQLPELLGIQIESPPKDSDISSFKDLIINRRKVPADMIRNMVWKPQEY